MVLTHCHPTQQIYRPSPSVLHAGPDHCETLTGHPSSVHAPEGTLYRGAVQIYLFADALGPQKNFGEGGGGLNFFAHKSFVGKYFSDQRHLHCVFEAKGSRWVYEESRLESIRKILQCVTGI